MSNCVINKKSRITLTAVLLAALAVSTQPDIAFAQEAGVGGGQGASVIEYFVSNIFTDLLDAAVIGAGIVMWFGRWHWSSIALVAVGGLVATNYSAIAALI